MGLFDAAFGDPNTMGLLAAAAQGLQLSGPSTRPIGTGQILGAMLGGGMQGYQGALKEQRESQRQKLDMDKDRLSMDLLKQQIAQATRKNNLINNMLEQYSGLGGGTSAAIQALSEGAKVGDIGPTVTNAARMDRVSPQSQSGTSINGIPRTAIAHDLAFNDGKNIAEWMFKRGVPDMQVHNGYAYDKNVVQPGFLPGLSVSQNGQATITMPDGRGGVTVAAPPGALDTFGAYKRLEEENKANFNLLPLDYADRSGRPVGGSVGSYLRGQQQPAQRPSAAPSAPAAPQNFPAVSPAEQAARDDDALLYAKQDIDNAPTPEAKAQAQQVYDTMLARRNAGQSVVTGDAAAEGGLQSGAEREEQIGNIKLKQGTQAKINENWITSSFNPVIEAGRAATSLNASLDALSNIDLKTGWATEGKAAGANFLVGLGIAPQNAEMFATNVQRFQSVAMDRLLTVLQAQKGPQTEGDSTRAQQTFAQLKNTPLANQFIIDFARAKANADARRAAFYQEALPLAQAEGDLSKVDREWKKIQGSIWDDPILQKWVKK